MIDHHLFMIIIIFLQNIWRFIANDGDDNYIGDDGDDSFCGIFQTAKLMMVVVLVIMVMAMKIILVMMVMICSAGPVNCNCGDRAGRHQDICPLGKPPWTSRSEMDSIDVHIWNLKYIFCS